MAWCFADEASESTQAIRRSLASEREALVPNHWSLEVANALLQAERRGRINRAITDRFLSLLGSLPIATDLEGHTQATVGLMDLARETGLTSYDAAYLDLARRCGLPLASLDRALHAAAARV